MIHYEVVAAVIVDDKDRIFCAQRGNYGELANKWEFPGGKIESGESRLDALIREIREELDTEIEVLNHIITVDHQYKTFKLTMHAFYSKVINGKLQLSEHINSKWLERNELCDLDWADADVPIINILKRGVKT